MLSPNASKAPDAGKYIQQLNKEQVTPAAPPTSPHTPGKNGSGGSTWDKLSSKEKDSIIGQLEKIVKGLEKLVKEMKDNERKTKKK